MRPHVTHFCRRGGRERARSHPTGDPRKRGRQVVFAARVGHPGHRDFSYRHVAVIDVQDCLQGGPAKGAWASVDPAAGSHLLAWHTPGVIRLHRIGSPGILGEQPR